MAAGAQPRREMDQYAALFVALIGEGADPQGVVSTSDGRVVRAFHRFTLVDQSRALLMPSCSAVNLGMRMFIAKALHAALVCLAGLLCAPDPAELSMLSID
jgi:hypothetical protein